ncbi:MAG TPA: DUF983 domain-containing protein [Pyrinomonadaceae bacterium]
MDIGEARKILVRGLKLRCPACGRGSLYQSAFKMHERCTFCGLTYGREQGYFVGAIYINVMATEALILLVYLVSIFTGMIGDRIIFPLLIGMAITLPLIFFRFSRSLWLSIDHIISPHPHQPKASL